MKVGWRDASLALRDSVVSNIHAAGFMNIFYLFLSKQEYFCSYAFLKKLGSRRKFSNNRHKILKIFNFSAVSLRLK